jgi:hypothetical protein
MDDANKSRGRAGGGGCPHVNRNDLRCGTRFRLDRLDQAFRVCFGSYHACPMYHRINAEQDELAAREAQEAAVVRITVAGHGVSSSRSTGSQDEAERSAGRPLRATGT